VHYKLKPTSQRILTSSTQPNPKSTPLTLSHSRCSISPGRVQPRRLEPQGKRPYPSSSEPKYDSGRASWFISIFIWSQQHEAREL